MVEAINAVGNVRPVQIYSNRCKTSDLVKPVFTGGDKVELSTVAELPKISRTRLAFNRLTDEQIATVNETGKLPDNAKFIPNGFGGYTICNNYFGLRSGTQKLPIGFEVKKNVLGFTCVLPIGTKGLMVKS